MYHTRGTYSYLNEVRKKEEAKSDREDQSTGMAPNFILNVCNHTLLATAKMDYSGTVILIYRYQYGSFALRISSESGGWVVRILL